MLKHTPFDPGLRAEVSASGSGRLVDIGADGADRLVAQWAFPAVAIKHADVALARSPSGERAAVRLDGTVWTFALATGELVGHHAAAPDPSDPGILVWGKEELASIWLATDGQLEATLAPGVRISILGPVDEDGGEATSGGGAGFLYFDPGTPQAAKDEALAQAREDAEAAAEDDLRLRLAVAFDGRETLVHDDRATYRAGLMRVQWPPLTGPRGVLLRRVRVQSQPPQPGTRQTGRQEYEVQHPLLITPGGEVRTLPFEFGNRPLTTMHDSRFLLPCYGPMWWDGPNEGLSAVADDGRTEQLHSGGEHVTPMGTVRSVDPSLVPVEDPGGYHSDDAWSFVAATCGPDGLTLALERGNGRAQAGGSWLLVVLPLDGVTCGPPRRIAGGTPPPDTIVRIVV